VEQWTIDFGHPVRWGVATVLALVVIVSIGAAALDLPNVRV
jgi:hypothetical protein